jgi:hypothetical protein
MSESTRRGFLKVAGAGAAAGAAAVAAGAVARSGHTPAAVAGATVPAHASGPLVAYVRDVRGAEVSVMVGETEVVVHDADLVARLVNARARTSAATSV